MEESLGTGSNEPVATTTTRGTTSKLPPENAADNTNQPTATNDGQSSTPYRVDSLQLVVIEGFQVGRGVARIDPSDMAKLGCQPGDIIMITGARTTAAKVVPSAIVDRGQQTIQMDSQVRQNSASGLGERVIPPVQPQPITDVEAVMVQPGTIVRAQARGATNGAPGRVSYEDIGGLGKELQRIREMIELPLKYPAVFDRLGVEPPKGVLLYGPPGTGKTLIARVVAAETNAAFFIINGPEIINKFYGESESRLRSVFQEAQRRAPSIIFIDELDALAPKRTEIGGEVERRIVGQLLALMDGMASRGQVVLIGATNQPNALDPALRRPGRFDREIALRVPDVRGRMEILRIHSKDAALGNDIDFARLAQLTPGFVGADLEALCREAAMIALRRVLPHIDYQRAYIPYETLVNLNITMADFQAALREVEPSTTREVYVEFSETTWNDIGGLEKTKAMLTEGVEWPLRFPEIYANAKVEAPRGVLLSGPPGSGKTLIARALANQCEANFISIKGPELLSKWVGESEKGIREVFRRAKQAAPCIVFFDELDALAPRRAGGELDGQVGNRVIAQLLTEMDGIEGREGVIVLAATNRSELIDPALLRPGRFDLVVELEYPTEEERSAIFAVHTRGKPLVPEITMQELAQLTPGRSGADIEAICRRASLLALREWIAPRLSVGRVQVTEETEGNEPSSTAETEAEIKAETKTETAKEDSFPALPNTRFLIRPEHFARAIDEQRERYAVQAEAEETISRREEGRQRLIEMASNYSTDGKPPLRGFRLWLARLFGLVPS